MNELQLRRLAVRLVAECFLNEELGGFNGNGMGEIIESAGSPVVGIKSTNDYGFKIVIGGRVVRFRATTERDNSQKE